MRSLSEPAETDDYLCWLIYGPPGSWKTSFAGRAALDERMCDVAYVAIEGGLLTLRGVEWPHTAPYRIDCPDITEMEKVFWALQAKRAPFTNVKTIVIDSGTEFYTKDLESTVSRNLHKTSRDGKQRSSIDDIWLQDRGETGARVARLYRWFRDLPTHLIITAHPKYTYPKGDEDAPREDLAPIRVTPAFGPAMLRHVAGYCDFVWAFAAQEDRALIMTQPRGNSPYFVKTRSEHVAARLPKVMHWPAGKNIITPLLDCILDATPMPEWAHGVESEEEGDNHE